MISDLSTHLANHVPIRDKASQRHMSGIRASAPMLGHIKYVAPPTYRGRGNELLSTWQAVPTRYPPAATATGNPYVTNWLWLQVKACNRLPSVAMASVVAPSSCLL